jgi:PadR family transcriptional regulator, regulatory protein PadR
MDYQRTEMRTSTYFVLAALLDGPLHGYAILKRIVDLSGGDVSLTTGTLYGALDRLLEHGLVEAGAEEIVNGRVRRAYRLTPAGVDALIAEAAHLRAAAQTVESRLAGLVTGTA